MNDFANLQPHTVSGTTKAPDGYKVNPLFVEKRTKRVNLVIQPSTYEKARQRAIKGGFRSFNDYVHTLIENDYNKG